MKTILVPTDFSSEADNALDVAYVVAKKTNAAIQMLHVVEAPHTPSLSVSGTHLEEDGMNKVYVLMLMERALKDLKCLVADKGYSDVRFSYDVKVGNVYSHVTEFITEKEIDLIVMGTKGKGGIKEMFVGSNTEKVVRLAKCLVLAVKDKTDVFNIDNVVLATEPDDYSSELIVKVRDLQKMIGFKLHLLFVNTPSNFISTDEAMVSLKEIAKIFRLEDYSLNIINEYTVENGIMEFVLKVKADIVAMSTHGRKGISHLLNGSISEEMVKYSGKPILTHIME
jgi:nucleotide-binding universal stress UspA family protein